MSKPKKGTRPLYLFFAAVFIIMFALTFITPMIADDFSYSFSFDEDIPITSISQIPSSMACHRNILNGRVVAHFIVQLMLMLPKVFFSLFNALNLVLLFYLFSRFFSGSSFKTTLLALGAFFIWNYTPAFGQVFFWLDGAVNYSWGISFFLLFILPYALIYINEYEKPNPVLQAFHVIFGFLVGAYSENGSVAVLFIIIVLSLLIFIRDKKLPAYLLFSILSAVCGFIFLMSAPATASRAGSGSLSDIIRSLKLITERTREQMLPIYIVYICSFIPAFLSKKQRPRLHLSLIFLLAGMGSLAAFIFANYFTDRHFCFTVLFTVLGCLINFSVLCQIGKKSILQLITAAAAVVFVFNFILGALDIGVIFIKSRERAQLIQEALLTEEKAAQVEIYLPSTKYSAACGLDDASPDPAADKWPNISMRMYYGLNSIVGYMPD